MDFTGLIRWTEWPLDWVWQNLMSGGQYVLEYPWKAQIYRCHAWETRTGPQEVNIGLTIKEFADLRGIPRAEEFWVLRLTA
jgi:hypothetical protein